MGPDPACHTNQGRSAALPTERRSRSRCVRSRPADENGVAISRTAGVDYIETYEPARSGSGRVHNNRQNGRLAWPSKAGSSSERSRSGIRSSRSSEGRVIVGVTDFVSHDDLRACEGGTGAREAAGRSGSRSCCRREPPRPGAVTRACARSSRTATCGQSWWRRRAR